MNKSVIIIGCIVLGVITAYAITGLGSQKNIENPNPSLNWNTNLTSALQESKATNKPLFIDIYSTSCQVCKKLDENTLTDSKVQEKLKSNYVLLKIDSDKNPDVNSKYKIYGLPTILIVDSNGNEIKRIEGYVDASTLLNRI